jgi:hypothetical protein
VSDEGDDGTAWSADGRRILYRALEKAITPLAQRRAVPALPAAATPRVNAATTPMSLAAIAASLRETLRLGC